MDASHVAAEQPSDTVASPVQDDAGFAVAGKVGAAGHCSPGHAEQEAYYHLAMLHSERWSHSFRSWV